MFLIEWRINFRIFCFWYGRSMLPIWLIFFFSSQNMCNVQKGIFYFKIFFLRYLVHEIGSILYLIFIVNWGLRERNFCKHDSETLKPVGWGNKFKIILGLGAGVEGKVLPLTGGFREAELPHLALNNDFFFWDI